MNSDNIEIKHYAECKVINPNDKEYKEIIEQLNKSKEIKENMEVEDG